MVAPGPRNQLLSVPPSFPTPYSWLHSAHPTSQAPLLQVSLLGTLYPVSRCVLGQPRSWDNSLLGILQNPVTKSAVQQGEGCTPAKWKPESAQPLLPLWVAPDDAASTHSQVSRTLG